MNENEIVKLRVMQVDDRDVPAKYVEAFNSYLDKVVIPHFEKQLEEKDKNIAELRDLLEMSLQVETFDQTEKRLRHQICEKINDYIDKLIIDRFGDETVRYLTIDVEDFTDFLEKFEKGDEE